MMKRCLRLRTSLAPGFGPSMASSSWVLRVAGFVLLSKVTTCLGLWPFLLLGLTFTWELLIQASTFQDVEIFPYWTYAQVLNPCRGSGLGFCWRFISILLHQKRCGLVVKEGIVRRSALTGARALSIVCELYLCIGSCQHLRRLANCLRAKVDLCLEIVCKAVWILLELELLNLEEILFTFQLAWESLKPLFHIQKRSNLVPHKHMIRTLSLEEPYLFCSLQVAWYPILRSEILSNADPDEFKL